MAFATKVYEEAAKNNQANADANNSDNSDNNNDSNVKDAEYEEK